MGWRRIVIRPDSIIRWWTLAQLDVVSGFAHVSDSEHLRTIDFKTLLAISDGSEHVRTEEMASFGGGLIRASAADPRLFQRIGQYYERLIARWLAYSRDIAQADLSQHTDLQLDYVLKRWIKHYIDFSPILFVPFVVERRYAEEYPALIEKLAGRVYAEAQQLMATRSLRFYGDVGAVSTTASPDDIRDAVKSVVEYSPRRTVAEQKELKLRALAVAIEGDGRTSELFHRDRPPTVDELTEASRSLAAEFASFTDEFRWLSHWGYPPRYADSTDDDFLNELQVRIRRGAIAGVENVESREREAAAAHRRLLRRAGLDERERQLIADINYYNFLRTSRMESKIRAQYLSVPLFREIERRALDRNLLSSRDDIFLMTPPETSSMLNNGTVPPDVADRRRGWVLLTNARSGGWTVYSGKSQDDFEEYFYGVITHQENAHGLHNPTSAFVGGKGAGLFRLLQAGFQVPPFLVVTADAYRRAHSEGEHHADGDAAAASTEATARRSPRMATAVDRALRDNLAAVGPGPFAVRSSATVEDSSDRSWAGRFDSLLDVDEADLQSAIPSIWASLHSDRALSYADSTSSEIAEASMAVVVQAMVSADAAGVINTTLDFENADIVEIEVALGYGLPVVAGEVSPDRFLVRVDQSAHIVDRSVGKQNRMLTRQGWTELSLHQASEQKIDDTLILELAQTAKRIERELGGPQDVEFAIAERKIWIVQSRPMTGLQPTLNRAALPIQMPDTAKLVAIGLKGKKAIAHQGTAQVLTSLDQAQAFVDGNVLVVTAATPAWDPVVFRASALVTDDGGATSHAIRVANEMGIPAVVGTTSATEAIPDGANLLIDTASDPFKGRVYLVSEPSHK
jgi:pyruvate,water dikinase